MGNNILKNLTKNLGTKLMAFVFAILLWLVVYNMDDPNKTGTFTTSVTVTNIDHLTEQNLSYEVLNKSNSVTFTITAKRSYLERLENSNFTATADLKKMVIDSGEKDKARVPVDIVSSMYNAEITYGTKKYLEISLEDLMSKKIQVTGKSKGNVAEGCAVGKVRVISPTVIKVSGPESIVKKVENVEATIDVSDMSIDISDSVVPKLLDEKGKEVDATRLTLSNSTVSIEAKILNVKEVNIKYQTNGTPAAHFRVAEVRMNPSKVKVKGNIAALNALTSIDIPGEALNIEGASDDVTTEVDISEYLPEDVELVDNNQRMVTVTVAIQEYQTRTFHVLTSNISMKDIPAGHTAAWKNTIMDVEISGLKGDLDALKAEEIKGNVSLNNLSKGSHNIRVALDLDEKYQVSRIYAPVVIH